MNKYLYHITTKEALPEILKNGLKPMIGNNSQLVDESIPAVYLCRHKDVPYWRILLDKSVVLKIDISYFTAKELDDIFFSYELYAEYVYRKEIPPHIISRCYIPLQQERQMRDLCMGYLHRVSYLTVVAARYYTDNDMWRYASIDVKNMIDETLKILKRLDYSVCEKSDIRNELRTAAEYGEWTFDDLYISSNKRLYQQLLLYGNDELTQSRKKLYKYICTNFKGCLRVNTGCWS